MGSAPGVTSKTARSAAVDTRACLLSLSQLRAALRARGVSFAQCVEKHELAALLQAAEDGGSADTNSTSYERARDEGVSGDNGHREG
eukprot:4334753-Pleurochrysis_carterae.AAC.1